MSLQAIPTGELKFDGPLRVVGHTWERQGTGWRRQLVRKILGSGTNVVCDLHPVNGKQPFCPACLGTAVDVKQGVGVLSAGEGVSQQTYRCLSPACGIGWHYVPEQQDVADD